MSRIERNQLAESLRHYISRQISNFEFIERTEEIGSSNDKGVRSIIDRFWLFYDDIREHKNEGSFKLSIHDEDYIKRCILFLKSDYKYEWPNFKYEGIPFLRSIIYLVTSGRFPKKWDDKIIRTGDYHVWPFFSEPDFKKTVSNPKYLNKI